eukprot:8168138-Alexandrium_andersonii.AAC.1
MYMPTLAWPCACFACLVLQNSDTGTRELASKSALVQMVQQMVASIVCQTHCHEAALTWLSVASRRFAWMNTFARDVFQELGLRL